MIAGQLLRVSPGQVNQQSQQGNRTFRWRQLLKLYQRYAGVAETKAPARAVQHNGGRGKLRTFKEARPKKVSSKLNNNSLVNG